MATSIVERLISIIAPHRCIVCGDEDSVLCTGCQGDLSPSLLSMCALCDRPTKGSAVCIHCRQHTALSYIWVANSYEGVIAKLIRRFKFSHVKAAARPLAHNLANSLPYLAPDTLLVPIPTVINHVRMRGYDHALLLAKELGHLTGLQCKSLLRRNNKLRQVGQGRKQRKIQAKSAFYTSPRLDCRGAHILLIDDVITTGATLEAAAAELYRIGAKQVDAVVVAKQALKL